MMYPNYKCFVLFALGISVRVCDWRSAIDIPSQHNIISGHFDKLKKRNHRCSLSRVCRKSAAFELQTNVFYFNTWPMHDDTQRSLSIVTVDRKEWRGKERWALWVPVRFLHMLKSPENHDWLWSFSSSDRLNHCHWQSCVGWIGKHSRGNCSLTDRWVILPRLAWWKSLITLCQLSLAWQMYESRARIGHIK